MEKHIDKAFEKWCIGRHPHTRRYFKYQNNPKGDKPKYNLGFESWLQGEKDIFTAGYKEGRVDTLVEIKRKNLQNVTKGEIMFYIDTELKKGK